LHEWDAAAAALSRHYRVYRIDLLGFGRSEKPAITVSSYLYALLINDFTKHVIGEKTFVAANNLSCSFAAVAAQLAPSQYAKFLFVAPHAVRQDAPSCKQAWLKRLFECPILGTSIYLAMTSRCLLRAHLERFGVGSSAMARRQADAFYDAAHHGGANARYPLASFLTNYLYVDTDRALRAVPHPIQILDDGEGLYPHIDNPRALYHACRKFFDA